MTMQADTPGQHFLPSEICRLVLGFLKEENYMKTYWCFLKECVHLAEYNSLLKKGREYPTTIMGLSLLAMLDDYAKLKLQQQGVYSNTSPQPGGMPSIMNQLDSVLTDLKRTIPKQQKGESYANLCQSSRTRVRNREQQQGLPSRFLCFSPGTPSGRPHNITVSANSRIVPFQNDAVATVSSSIFGPTPSASDSTVERTDESDAEVDVVSQVSSIVAERVGVGVPVPNSSVVLVSMSPTSKIPVSGSAHVADTCSTTASSASSSSSAASSSVVPSSTTGGSQSGNQPLSDATVIGLQQPKSSTTVLCAVSAVEAGLSSPKVVRCRGSLGSKLTGGEVTHLALPEIASPSSISGSKDSESQYFTPMAGPSAPLLTSESTSQPTSGSSVFITPSSQLSPQKDVADILLPDGGSFTQVPNEDMRNPDFSPAKHAPSKRRKTKPKRRQDSNSGSYSGSGVEDIRKMDKVIKTAVNSSHLLNGLADKINKGWYDIHKQQQQTATTSSQSQDPQAVTISQSDSSSSTDLTSMDHYMESILSKDQFMSEDAVKNIINMTRNENILDDVFDIFGVDKEEFLERELGSGNLSTFNQSPPPAASQEGLHTPPHIPHSEFEFLRPSTSAILTTATSITTTTTTITTASFSDFSQPGDVTFSAKCFNSGNGSEKRTGALGSGDHVQILPRSFEPAQPLRDEEKPRGPEVSGKNFMKEVDSVQPSNNDRRLCGSEVTDVVVKSLSMGEAVCKTSKPLTVSTDGTEKKTFTEKMKTMQYLDEQTGIITEVVSVVSESDNACDAASLLGSGDNVGNSLDIQIPLRTTIPLSSGDVESPTSLAPLYSQGEVSESTAVHHSLGSDFHSTKALPTSTEAELSMMVNSEHSYCYSQSQGDTGRHSQGHNPAGYLEDSVFSEPPQTPATPQLRDSTPISPLRSRWGRLAAAQAAEEMSNEHQCQFDGTRYGAVVIGDLSGCSRNAVLSTDVNKSYNLPSDFDTSGGSQCPSMDLRIIDLSTPELSAESGMSSAFQISESNLGRTHSETQETVSFDKRMEVQEVCETLGSQQVKNGVFSVCPVTPMQEPQQESSCPSEVSQSSVHLSKVQMSQEKYFPSGAELSSVSSGEGKLHLHETSQACSESNQLSTQKQQTLNSASTVTCLNEPAILLPLEGSHTSELPFQSEQSPDLFISPAETQNVSPLTRSSPFHSRSPCKSQHSPRKSTLSSLSSPSESCHLSAATLPFLPSSNQLHESENQPPSEFTPSRSFPVQDCNHSPAESSPTKSGPSVPDSAKLSAMSQQSPTLKFPVEDHLKSASNTLSALEQPTKSGSFQAPDCAISSQTDSAIPSQTSPTLKSTLQSQKSSSSEQPVDSLTHAASIFVRLKHMLSQSHLVRRQSEAAAADFEQGASGEQLSGSSENYSHQRPERRSGHAKDIANQGDAKPTLESQYTSLHPRGNDSDQVVFSDSSHSRYRVSAQRQDHLNVSESMDGKHLASPLSKTHLVPAKGKELTSLYLGTNSVPHTPICQHSSKLEDGKQHTSLHTRTKCSVPVTMSENQLVLSSTYAQLVVPHTPAHQQPPSPPQAHRTPSRTVHHMSPDSLHRTPPRAAHQTPTHLFHRTPPRSLHRTSPHHASHLLHRQLTLFSPIKSPFSPRSASSINSTMSPGRLRLLNEPVPEEVLEELSRHSDSCFSDAPSVGQPGSPWMQAPIGHRSRIDEEEKPCLLKGLTFHRSSPQQSPSRSVQLSQSKSASAVSRKLTELSCPSTVCQQPSAHVSSARESNPSNKEPSEDGGNRTSILSKHGTPEANISRATSQVSDVGGEQHSSSGDIFISAGFSDETGRATISMPFPVAVQQFLDNQIETGELQVPLDLTNHDLALNCSKTPTPSPQKSLASTETGAPRRSPRKTPRKQPTVKRLSVKIGQCGSLSTSRSRGKDNISKKASPSKELMKEKRCTRSSSKEQSKRIDNEEIEMNTKKLRLRQPGPFAEVSELQHVTPQSRTSGVNEDFFVRSNTEENIACMTDLSKNEQGTSVASSLRQQKLASNYSSGDESPAKLTDKQKKNSPLAQKRGTHKNMPKKFKAKASAKLTKNDTAGLSKSTKTSSLNQKKLSTKHAKRKKIKKSAVEVTDKPKEESSDDDFSIYSFSALSSSDYTSSSSTDSDIPLIEIVKRRAEIKKSGSCAMHAKSNHPNKTQSPCETYTPLSNSKKSGSPGQLVEIDPFEQSCPIQKQDIVPLQQGIDETDSSPLITVNSSAFAGAGLDIVMVTTPSESWSSEQKEEKNTASELIVNEGLKQRDHSASSAVASTSQTSLPPKKRLAAGKKPVDASEKLEIGILPKKNPVARKDLRLMKPKQGQLPRRLPVVRKKLDLLSHGSPEHPFNKENSNSDSDVSSTKSLRPASGEGMDAGINAEIQAGSEQMEFVPPTGKKNKNTVIPISVKKLAESNCVESNFTADRENQEKVLSVSTEKLAESKSTKSISLDRESGTSSEEVDVCELSDEDCTDLKKEKTPTSQSDRKKKAIIAAKKKSVTKSKSSQGSSKSSCSISQKTSTPVKKQCSIGSKSSSEKKANTSAGIGGQVPMPTGWGQQNQTFHFMPMTHPPQGVGIQKYGPYRRIKPIMISKDISTYFASVRNRAGAQQNMFDIGPVPSPSCSVFSTVTSPISAQFELTSCHTQPLGDAAYNNQVLGAKAAKNVVSPKDRLTASSPSESHHHSSTASAFSDDRPTSCLNITASSLDGPSQFKSPPTQLKSLPTGLTCNVLSTVSPTLLVPRATQSKLVGEINGSPAPMATSTPLAVSTAPLIDSIAASNSPKEIGFPKSKLVKRTGAADCNKPTKPKKAVCGRNRKGLSSSPKSEKNTHTSDSNKGMSFPEIVHESANLSTKDLSHHVHQGSAVETEDGTIAITFDSIETEQAVRALIGLSSPEKLQETRDSVIAYKSKEKLCSEQSQDIEEMIVVQERSTDSEILSHSISTGKEERDIKHADVIQDEEAVHELPDFTSVPGEPSFPNPTSSAFSCLSLKRKRDVSPTQCAGKKTPRLEPFSPSGQKTPSKDNVYVTQITDVPPGQGWSMPFLGEVAISPSKPRHLPEEMPNQENFSVIHIEDPSNQAAPGSTGGQATASSSIVNKFSTLLEQLESGEQVDSSSNSSVSVVSMDKRKKGNRKVKKVNYVQTQNMSHLPSPSQTGSLDIQHQTIQESAESTMQPQQPSLQLALLPPTGTQTHQQVALIHTRPEPSQSHLQLEKDLLEMKKSKQRKSKQQSTPKRRRRSYKPKRNQQMDKVSVITQEVFMTKDRYGIRTSILLPKLPRPDNSGVLLPKNLQAQVEGTASRSPYIMIDEAPLRDTSTGPERDISTIPQETTNTHPGSQRHMNPLDAAMMSTLPELMASPCTNTKTEQASAVVTVPASPLTPFTQCSPSAILQATQNFKERCSQFENTKTVETEFSGVVTALSSPQPLVIDNSGRISEANSPLPDMHSRKLYRETSSKGISQDDPDKGCEDVHEEQTNSLPSLSQDIFSDFTPSAVPVPDAEMNISLSNHTSLTSLNPVSLAVEDPVSFPNQSSVNILPPVTVTRLSSPNPSPCCSQAQYNNCSSYNKTAQLTSAPVGYSHASASAVPAPIESGRGVVGSSASAVSVVTDSPMTSFCSQPNKRSVPVQRAGLSKVKKVGSLSKVDIDRFLNRKVHGNT